LNATIILVPEDYLTIQDGMNKAENGDTVLVNIGTYFENINYNGKNIVVGSLFLVTQDSTYISQTIIDGNQNGSVVSFNNGENNNAILCGFTIQNGLGTITEIAPGEFHLAGGGIFITDYSSPVITNCIIMNNTRAFAGGGIYLQNYCNPVIYQCIIKDNEAMGPGGGIYCIDYTNMRIDDCHIFNCSALGGDGGGIEICRYSEPTITNCTIENNTGSRWGGGIGFTYWCGGYICNSTINDNCADGYGGGIHCLNASYPTFEECSIISNSAGYGGGVCCETCPDHYLGKPIFTSCSIAHNISTSSVNAGGGGVYFFDSNSEFNDCQICSNTTTGVYGGGLCVRGSNSQICLSHCIISNNNGGGCNLQDNGYLNFTFCNVINNTGGGLYIGGETCTERGAIINSCIIWSNEPHQIYLEGSSSYINFWWSDLQDGEDGIINNGGTINWGWGNIDEYPLFVEEGNHLYHLLEGSSCIDAGNPLFTDPDGTRSDMGCYPTVYDVKKIKDKWNWVSFPRLQRDGNEPVAADSVLMNIEPFPTYLELKGYVNGAYVNLIYDNEYWYHYGLYDIVSTSGYKLWTSNTDNSYLPLDGNRLAPDIPITLLGEPYWNWIGYWLPQTLMSDVAFGDEWDNVRYIKGEDYFYFDGSQERGGNSATYTWGPIPMRYGKGYMVQVHNTIQNFQWNNSDAKISPPEKSAPQNFDYTDKPDYEAIDIVDIDESIIEIGVFEDDICVGAAVVDSGRAQILAYTDFANRDENELTFQIVYGRGDKQEVKSYLVYDFAIGEYVERKLIAGRQGYSIVRLNSGEDITIPNTVSLSQNIPNPFNPDIIGTTISYALPEESVVEISVYNIRGQRVKTLVSGKTAPGRYSITWNGKNDNDKRLGNGIYFYKLSTGKKKIIKKMLLMH
jgi:hypothetical protein